MTITLNQVQHLADQLLPLDQMGLIEHLPWQFAPTLVRPLDAPPSVGAKVKKSAFWH